MDIEKKKFKCSVCNSNNIKKQNKPEFHWASFALHGVQPIEIQKLICKDCDKIFGNIDMEEYLKSDVLMEIIKL